MRLKSCCSALCMMLISSMAVAQTNYTSKIANPSFESGNTGWTMSGFNTQTNDVFSIKSGQTYIEKWVGIGGAVGNASVSQTLSSLLPGQYTLTVAAQNIQEDTPSASQTGTWIFAGDNQTAVTVRNDYSVDFTYVNGEIEIGFKAVNASGNWIAVDNFRLTMVNDDLSGALSEAIIKAEKEYGTGNGNESQSLKAAIDAAKEVAADTSATGQQQADAIMALEAAIEAYKCANASAENPLDRTNLIVNNSFEEGNFTGWTNVEMSTQTNSVFSIKQGTYYIERWTSKGSAVGNASVKQTINGMYPGKYILKVAAQNIQEDDPTQSQTGAWIFANSNKLEVTTRKNYSMEFVLVSDQLEIGFEAKDASGNWIAVDNFRLEYIDNSFELIKAEYNALIAKAEELVSQRINPNAKEQLEGAISTAKPLASQSTTDGWASAAKELEAAISTATTSSSAFTALLNAIETAQSEIDSSSASNKTDYQSAIQAARGIYDNASTTDNQALEAIEALADAAFAFKIANGTGAIPKVVTDPRFIKGSTWAFGRSTVSGSNIIERGFCWSETPNPSVLDNRTTEYINQAGMIYWLRDLKPGTMYYMRAYAITKDYAVGYGDVIKFATVPKGQITHWYNNGGDEDVNNRISYAINTAIDYYWNNLTSIHGFGISVTYSPGTPTADCSYGGGMRVGANSSYQQPGTIMHESLHGIGVGTHGMWWSADMRENGDRGVWLGDRVTEAVRFWDNSTTATITGDNTHLWPYGCNGASEDSHTDNLYCMMGIIAQALNEDGLPGSSAIGYALPYYSFTHDDDLKYYIKNEDADHGLYSSYLVETATHTLQWKTMTADEAAANESAAWYITFTPTNQYYQFKNAKTGYYMTYSSSTFKTVKHTTPTTADYIHLMRGRVDVDIEGNTFRGYYFIHPESSANPPVLTANTTNKTTSQSFNIAKTATTQRWLILTAEEAQTFEAGSLKMEKAELTDILRQLRELAATPHSENTEGTDATFDSQLNNIQAAGDAATTVTEVSKLIDQAKEESITFLSGVYIKEGEQPFDLTYMLSNPNFDTDATTGWTYNSNVPGYGYQGAEYFQSTFNFSQTLKNMPVGTYKLCANAFQRPGAYNAVLAPYNAGTANVTTSLYIGSTSEPVKHICDDRQKSSPHSGSKQLSDNTYIPDDMASAEAYFAKGLYESSVTAEQTNKGNLKIGIKCTKSDTSYWSMFDTFRLYFYGTEPDITGIDDILISNDMENGIADKPIYNLQGQLMGTSLKGLPQGIYIVGGKKVLVK